MLFTVTGCLEQFNRESKKVSVTPDTTQRGSTIGNIANRGWVAYNEGWVYYNDEGREGGVFKIRLDGSERIRLANTSGWFINVSDDYVYYYNRYTDPIGIYRAKTDGSGYEMILNTYAEFLTLIDDWLYFTTATRNGGVFRVQTDGSNLQKIVEGQVNVICVDRDWIYLSGPLLSNEEGYWPLYRVKTDGSSLKMICETRVYGEELQVHGDYVYTVSYRVKKDGSGKAENYQSAFGLDGVRYSVTRFNFDKDWFYFWDGYEEVMYRAKTDGSRTEKFDSIGQYGGFLLLAESWVYFTDFKYYYRMKNDGTVVEKLENYRDR